MDPFDGYPYLVTRIGHTQLRHITLVPAGWPRARLVELARRQRDANRLDTCLALGPTESIYFDANGIGGADADGRPSDFVPWGLPVTDQLATPERFDDTAELIDRRVRLARYAAANRGSGVLVSDGLQGGRPATPSDVDRLAGLDPSGLPPGLARCPVCDRLAGEFLAVDGEGTGDPAPLVIEVYCRCANHNRCAACGEPLTDSRLSAYRWSEPDQGVRYRPAYAALAHKCAVGPRDRAHNPAMSRIDVSCVTAANGWLCQVTIADDGSESRHSVTLTREDFQRLTTSGGTPDGLVRRSIEFLLEREPKEQILRSFALPDIGRYFPGYEGEIRKGDA